MKASDIVNQLANKLPNFSDSFTNNVSITSLTRVGFTATADTGAAHNLTVSQSAFIRGAESPITISSLTRVSTVGTLITASDHDITFDQFELTQSVELSGSVESEFNGSFVILSVSNRNTITFTMVDSGATVATGTPLLLNGSSIFQGYNGLFSVVSTPTTTQFTYTLTTTPPLTTATGAIILAASPRISSGISEERCIEAYTKQTTSNDLWAFVILGDVIASKSRLIDSDAVANIQRGEFFRQQLVQPFSIMVIIPTPDDRAARTARDLAEDIFPLLSKSLTSFKFNSGLTVGAQNPVIFVDHGFAAYNTAFYVHTYSFQQVADLTFDDTIGYDDDVAFRDIDTDIRLDVGTREDAIKADVNLDDVPL